MSRVRITLIVVGVISLLASAMALGSRDGSRAAAAAPPADPGRIVGPGRVEPISEEIAIGTEVGGRILQLLADEGDAVRAGDLMAVLDNRDYQAAVASARARLADARADLARTRNGSRVEEKHEAGASVAQAEAVLRQAELDAGRRRRLANEGIISSEDRDRADRDVDVARARVAELTARRALVDAGPRAEDRSRSEAAVMLAAASLRESEARLSKTEIRSPIDGVVLRRDSRLGETVSPEVPGTRLFLVADVSRLRVRVDVDESDVGRLVPGAAAYVTAATFGERRFTGRVVRIGQSLGRKNVYTDEPRERVDTKVLETLVELDPGMRLPIGLRVDATIAGRR